MTNHRVAHSKTPPPPPGEGLAVTALVGSIVAVAMAIPALRLVVLLMFLFPPGLLLVWGLPVLFAGMSVRAMYLAHLQKAKLGLSITALIASICFLGVVIWMMTGGVEGIGG